VGLAQRVIEASGISTVALSPIADLTAATGAPRVAAIEYPFGRTVGAVGDAEGQRAVVRAALRVVETARSPGTVVHLPFVWPEPPARARTKPPAPPPIASYLTTHPWHLPKLINRTPPD